MSDHDHHMMMRAVELAQRALGRTAPNPMVGCVLVSPGGDVVGEGWHRGPGADHAEVDAIKKAAGRAKDATAYVTLEPCDHHGNTPPCTGALVSSGVATVVIGRKDPNPVAAGGAKTLEQAGIVVRYADGAAAEACEAMLRPWVHALSSDAPYVFAKTAMSLDGFVATLGGESKWITGPSARQRGHRLRQAVDAIMVGVGTVLADDPALDPRPSVDDDWAPSPKLKIVLDTHLRTPLNAKLFQSPGDVVIFCGQSTDDARIGRLAQRYPSLRIFQISDRCGSLDVETILSEAAALGVASLLIEGGPTLVGRALELGVVHEHWVFTAPKWLGQGQTALGAYAAPALCDALSFRMPHPERLGEDLLYRIDVGRNQREVC